MHAYNSSHWEWRMEDQEFKAILSQFKILNSRQSGVHEILSQVEKKKEPGLMACGLNITIIQAQKIPKANQPTKQTNK